MRLRELAQVLDLEELTPPAAAESEAGTVGDAPGGAAGDAAGDAGARGSEPGPGPEITRAYASDLLSDVLANAPTGGLLITLQVHLNVIAVASHAGLHAVIFSCGRRPEADVIGRAAEEGLALYLSRADTFDLAGRLYELGLRGGSG